MRGKGLSGEVAVVTGADGGIGLCFCRELARRGASLVMVSIRDRELREAASRMAADYGVEVYPLTIDLCRENAAQEILSFLDSKGMDCSILINNAGIFSFAPVSETSEGKLRAFVDLHVRFLVDSCRLFGDRFAKRGGGRILNMSSMSCWMPMPGIAMYSATKSFIRVFSRAVGLELRESGVSVTVACPGGIATDLFGLPDNLKRLAVRIGAIARPETFARKAVDRMLRGKKQYINGLTNRLAILFVGMTPTWVRMQVKRQLLDRRIRRP